MTYRHAIGTFGAPKAIIHRDAVSHVGAGVFSDRSGVQINSTIEGNTEYLTLDMSEARALRDWLNAQELG